MPRHRNSELPDWGEERRASSDARGGALLRFLRNLFARPLAIRLKGFSFHVVLVDRRSPARDRSVSPEQLRAELSARLLNHSHEWATQVMRHLMAVHDTLGQSGWKGVQALPSRLLGRALAQAEMLCADEPSAAMTMLVERLSALKIAADIREDRKSVRRQKETQEKVERVQVSEATHEEFEELERSWTGTFPMDDSAGRETAAGARAR